MLELIKIRKDIDWLIKQIKCLLNKSNLEPTLSATEWSYDHKVATGNPYLKDTLVWFEGIVYKALQPNDGIPVSNVVLYDHGVTPPLPDFYKIKISNSTPALPCGSSSIPTTYPITVYAEKANPIVGDVIYNDEDLTSPFNGDGTYYWYSLAFGLEINSLGIITDIIDCS